MTKKDIKKKAPKKKRTTPKTIEREESRWNWDDDLRSEEDRDFDDDKW